MSDEYKDQLNLLEDKLEKIPDASPNKGLWESLLHVLTYFGGALQRMEKILAGNGNRDGLMDRMDNVEGRLTSMENKMGVIQSDVRETLNYTRRRQGMELAPSIPKDEKKTFQAWFVDKVLPNLVTAIITGTFTLFLLLIVIHIQELFP